ALHDVLHAVGQRRDRDLLALVHLLRRVLLDVVGRRLDLDHVRAELRGDLGRVGADVDRRLAGLAEALAARIAPDHHGEPVVLRPPGRAARPAYLPFAPPAAGENRKADAPAAEPQRVLDRPGDRRLRILAAEQRVAVVELQDQRDLAGVLARARLEEAE